jgi:dTDP-glucose 4,6-dehydratase
LSRDPISFLNKNNQFKNLAWLEFQTGNVETFTFPIRKFDFVIHAATEASEQMNLEQPLEMLENNIQGTKRMLDFAVFASATKFLFTSSGAVYGNQPEEISHVSENYCGGPDVLKPNAAYGEGKRIGELLCSIYARKSNLSITIARCFAFIGPYLPLDSHFAIGNFIKNGLDGNKILVSGDGTPRRSYLYAADLVIWLLVILTQGKNGEAYNVGSEEDINIEELAKRVSVCFENRPIVDVIGKRSNGPIRKYVPLVEKAKMQLGLQVYSTLDEAILKMTNFYK